MKRVPETVATLVVTALLAVIVAGLVGERAYLVPPAAPQQGQGVVLDRVGRSLETADGIAAATLQFVQQPSGTALLLDVRGEVPLVVDWASVLTGAGGDATPTRHPYRVAPGQTLGPDPVPAAASGAVTVVLTAPDGAALSLTVSRSTAPTPPAPSESDPPADSS